MSKQQGFTLAEILISLAIASVLAAVTMPAIASQLALIQLTKALDDTAMQFRRAQNFAMFAGQEVIVSQQIGKQWCLTLTTSVCDCLKEGDCIMLANTSPVSHQQHTRVELTASSFSSQSHSRFMPFTGSPGGQSGTLTFTRGGYQGNLIVSSQGRIRVCLHNVSLGNYPAC